MDASPSDSAGASAELEPVRPRAGEDELSALEAGQGEPVSVLDFLRAGA
jgi:hypothetical protein